MIVTIDVGGTKTLVSSFDQSGRPGVQHRFETPSDQNLFLPALLKILQENYPPGDIQAISIALPGTLLEDGTLVWAGNLPWVNLNLKDALKPHYNCPVLVENDANLAGLAEANVLSYKPRACLYITISTGIGSGIITNGRLDRAFAGSEVGHMVFQFGGQWINWESFASGRAIREMYGKYASEIDDPELWDEISERFAVGFLALIPALQPDVIIIGGSIGSYFPKYEKSLIHHIKKHLPEHIRLSPIIQAKHPEEAVIYGCYYYAVHQLTPQ